MNKFLPLRFRLSARAQPADVYRKLRLSNPEQSPLAEPALSHERWQ